MSSHEQQRRGGGQGDVHHQGPEHRRNVRKVPERCVDTGVLGLEVMGGRDIPISKGIYYNFFGGRA